MALVPVTHYQRPGLRPLVAPPVAGLGRGLWQSSAGKGYCVVGNTVYALTPAFGLTQIGTLTVPSPGQLVSAADNGTTICLVDGGVGGYTIDMQTNNFAALVDASGNFQGGIRADYMDTFLIFGPSPPGSSSFVSTLSNALTFSFAYVGTKTDYPDALMTLIVNRHELLLLGRLKSEIWYDAGNPAELPFAELPGAYIEHGIVAPYSVASTDISVIWLGQDLQGQGVVFRQKGYNTQRISNHAIEYALRQIVKAHGPTALADATAYTYQQDGHYFYVLTLPTGDQTWVFDEAIGEPTLAWHQRGWTDANGVLHRERPSCFAFIGGKMVVQDWQNGSLYELDPEYYFDTVGGIDYPISYTRTFPHIGAGHDENGQPVEANGKQLLFDSLLLDMECGTVAGDSSIAPVPQVTVRYSDDRGRTFSGSVLLNLGTDGQYLTWPTARQLGRARDRVFEVSWNGNGPAALNGAWVEARVLHN